MSSGRECSHDGCRATTREGKPFCPDHVTSNPYVAGILAQLREQEAEKARSRAEANGHYANEIMVVIHANNGVASLKLIARHAALELEFVRKTVRAMAREGRVVLAVTNKGSLMIRTKEKP